METLEYDIAVIGAGAAGLAAGAKCASAGLKTLILERDVRPGGVLPQCIHNGFGLHYFHEELTGPEFAGKMAEKARLSGAEFRFGSSVMELAEEGSWKKLTVYSKEYGVAIVLAKAVILAMGCRERNRGNLGIPGERPAGIFTAGTAQRLINMDGCIPGKTAVIVGSGDIGLIMARRLTWCGVKVKCVVEVLPTPSGLSRNIAQCLEDFNIPLRLSTGVAGIHGKERVEGITIAPLVNGEPDRSREERISCDTILFSVGLIPENELSRRAGIRIHPRTGGAVTDGHWMSSLPGVFACGNVLHVHDLVDYAAEEAERCAGYAIEYVTKGFPEEKSVPVTAGAGLRYTVPNSVFPGQTVPFFTRPLAPLEKGLLRVRSGEEVLAEKAVRYPKPAEMLTITLPEGRSSGKKELTLELIEA